jgi:uncharacterized membrane protein
MTLVTLFHTLLALALLTAALMAGFFYAYSISVIPGLAASGDLLAAVRAMQGINASTRTLLFAFTFFGALVFPLLAAAAVALAACPWQVVALTLAGALAYGLGVVAVTFAFNIPLNETLAAARPTAEQAVEVWRNYTVPWTAWNHLRTVSSILALTLLTAALILALRR